MDELNFLSKEETSTKIDEIFSELSNKEKNSLFRIHRILKNITTNETNTKLRKSLFLLSNICSPMIDLESRNDPFQPFMTWGNKRSFLPIDLIDEEILYLSSILDEDFPPILKARIADILWTYSKPKNKKHSEIAIENYISMDVFDDFFEPDVYVFWERAVMLAKQIKNNSLIEKIKSKLLNEIDHPSTNWDFHLLKIIEIFDNTDLDKGLKALDKISDEDITEIILKKLGYNSEDELDFMEKPGNENEKIRVLNIVYDELVNQVEIALKNTTSEIVIEKNMPGILKKVNGEWGLSDELK